MERKRIIITGIPGTGKTEIGEYFQKVYGYKHVDCEKLPGGYGELDILIKKPDEFISPLLKETKNVIVTWGFPPEPGKFAVTKFKENGFRLFWFDGNRSAAIREWLKGHKKRQIPEECLYWQLFEITRTKVSDLIQPIFINPFDENGNFKLREKIAKEILGHL